MTLSKTQLKWLRRAMLVSACCVLLFFVWYLIFFLAATGIHFVAYVLIGREAAQPSEFGMVAATLVTIWVLVACIREATS